MKNYEYNSNACENTVVDLWEPVEMSFADFFLNVSGGSSTSYHRYNYAWMDDIYVETLDEYINNSRN